MKNRYVAGIDEVGRGPLAGPVTVCVVLCDAEVYKKLKKSKCLPKLGKDSKKLKEKEREEYSKYLSILKKDRKINFSINHIPNTIIDTKGLSYAINKAINEGLKKIKVSHKNTEILLDGGLKVKDVFKQKTIIKGDEKEKVIAWASILAKVSRDELMNKLSKKYPEYGLEVHKGYGTLKHRQAIQKYGVSRVHRLSFCKNLF